MDEKFKPQTFDINSINGGNKFGIEDGISPEAVNAPIEASALAQSLATNQPDISEIKGNGTPSVTIANIEEGNPRFKFANLMGGIDEIKSTQEKHSLEIDLLFSVAEQNNQFYKATIEDEFVSRVTAGGLNVVDKSPAIVQEINGKTVKCKNLFNSKDSLEAVNISVYYDTETGYFTIPATTNAGGISASLYKLQTPIPANKKVAISIFCESGNLATNASVTIGGYHLGDVNSWQCTVSFPVNENIANKTYSRTFTTTNTVTDFWIFVNAGSTITTEMKFRVMFVEDENAPTEYQPYFTGLKNAFFNSIKSTGKNFIKLPYDFTVYTKDGITYTAQEDGGIKVKGTSTANAIRTLNNVPFVGQDIASKNGNANTANGCTVSGGKDGVIVAINATDGMAYMFVRAPETVDTVIYPMVQYASSDTNYEPYTENTYQLPYSVELGEWDRVYPQTGEFVKGTKTITFDGTEDWYSGVNGGVYTSITGDVTPNSYAISNLLEYSDEGYATGTFQVFQVGPQLWTIMFYNGMTNIEWKAYLAELSANGNPLIVAYKTNNPTVSEITAPKDYTAYSKGTETVIQGTPDNSSFGANPTITNQYYVLGGKPNES